MKHYINVILTAVLCVCILAISTVSVLATESLGDTTVLTSTEVVVSGTVIDTNSSAVEGGSSDTEGSVDGGAGDVSSDVTSDDTSSSGTTSDETSSDKTSSDETVSGESSSSDTTSKKPITSDGAGAGDTFIDETASSVTGSNSPSDTSVPNGLIGAESTDESEDDGNHYKGETTTAAVAIVKVIWIPILMIFACIVCLIYINVFVKPKYEPITNNETSKTVRRRK